MVKANVATVSGVRTVPGTRAQNRPLEAVKAEVGGHLSEAWSGALEVADAQVSIWSLKAVRLAMLACLGSAALSVLLALGIYGFILLDWSLSYALETYGIPWLSPVVRGGVYFLLPATLVLMVWHTTVGYGTTDEKESAHATV